MKAQVECFCCNIRQTQEAVEKAGKDQQFVWRVLQRVSKNYAQADPEWTPAFMTTIAHRIAQEMVGIEDIFYEEKRYYNQMALELYPQLKKYVEQSKNRLETALRIAIAGNIIDLGVYKEVKVNEILYQIEHTPWGIYDWDDFQADLESSKILLYIGDNAGEVVFDRVFLEEINQGRKIYFIVKERPISNDALREDAIEAGIDKVATILTTGQGEIGIDIERSPQNVQEIWRKADCILSKGQGNFETLSDRSEGIYFLLKAKCEAVSRELGVEQGALILKKNKKLEER
ncbi:MAG TPA: ARMT1-like domain-containing protein [Atribacter sp.]|jgi:uncharacterized protein with ATP-grasp and redox domains|uniref:Damage-control phosphatase ARMT1-like metal-binding domain-containing protein n=1 Tax=Candidatus Atribacter allofermentans TaxID=1852833 RepID=A0A1V5STL4_9BACT|nr:ARMT1-like domain-containing protein [Atribacter sp.]MDD3714558.1 ARMT1-like domain-containing protein [Atribacterota bacterium]OQA57880.1 MAG: hypothetical protein BWY41_01204 [Candidatus Atribacteria bacterium ADurb.Bin276]HHT09029.1 DUF89 family protein [Candidatus Atribacteria bacterium]MDI9595152.1 ARMT1-like domain-containing protein [Atribacterota bacterium]HQK83065.1 ARMT1-like domain-containing protein [Atribacter sp.]